MAATGEIYAHLFENRLTRLPLDLYWNVHLELEVLGDVDHDGIERIQSVACEWMTLPIKRWIDLDGISLADVLQPELIECTAYRGVHDWAEPIAVSFLSGLHVGTFNMSVEALVSADEVNEIPQTRLKVDGIVTFAGVYVPRQEGVFGIPKNPATALQPFADLGLLHEPILDGHQYKFLPRL